VARQAGIDYQYVCKGLSDTLLLLESGGIDMAVSPLTITKAREQSFDFSHQYFDSGLVFLLARVKVVLILKKPSTSCLTR
jgi:polar amino acid transport system substrate-binding protein